MMLHNAGTDALDQMLSGILAAHPKAYCKLEQLYCHALRKRELKENRVQLIISGGGGYGPMFAGFVANGLADAMLEGDFDCAPNAYALYETAKAIHSGCGVLFLTNHFTGDYLNNDMARELLHGDGIDAHVCYVSDDIFSARGEPKEKRGGLCGLALLLKVAAAAADAGLPLNDVARLVEKANARLRSVTVCLSVDEASLEFGAGFSGEAPAAVRPYESSAQLAREAVGFLLGELSSCEGSAHFIINRTRALSYLEGYVLLDDVKRQLEASGRRVAHCSTGCYFDAFPQKGCIVSVLLADEELEQFLRPVTECDFSI